MSFDPKSLFWKLKEANPVRYVWAFRRAMLILRIKLLAAWHRSTVEVDLAPDLRLGKQLRVTIDPQTNNVFKIGPRSYVGDRVVFILRGGEVLLGPETGLRNNVVLNVAGRLVFEERNVLSWGCVLHCAEAVTFEVQAGCADMATIADSTHYFTEPMAYYYENVRTAPIVIGANTWICPRASVVMGVTIGDHCIIGSNSVVTRDVPSGHLASGVPADDVRPIRLPWKAVERG